MSVDHARTPQLLTSSAVELLSETKPTHHAHIGTAKVSLPDVQWIYTTYCYSVCRLEFLVEYTVNI
jgi:hypothetical protein